MELGPETSSLAPESMLLILTSIPLTFFWATLCSLQDLSSPTRDSTRAVAVKAWNPNHWTTREFPTQTVLIAIITDSLYPKVTDSKEIANSYFTRGHKQCNCKGKIIMTANIFECLHATTILNSLCALS